VVGVACATAVLATFVPALQAARTSTIDALADAARPPKRNRLLIGASTRLPIPLLLGVRLAARRPRRLALSTLSVAVSVAGIVAILLEHVRLRSSSTIANPQSHRLSQAMLLITVMLVVLAVINALLITWATVLDGQKTSALARALGATPGQVSAGFVAAQLLSVLPGSVLGVPLGIALLQVVAKSSDAYKHTPVGSLLLVILGTWLIMSALTAVPARIGSRRPAAQALQDAPT
ncbi:MAG TPA: FtsX-like permease family protein, partial [Acidothermaceae bacterium]